MISDGHAVNTFAVTHDVILFLAMMAVEGYLKRNWRIKVKIAFVVDTS